MTARRNTPGSRIPTSAPAVGTSRRAAGHVRRDSAMRRIRVAGGSIAAVLLLLEAISVISAQPGLFVDDSASRVTFGAMTSVELTTANPASLVVADFNQDGHFDLVVTPSTNVLRGNGTGTLVPAINPVFAGASAVAAADFNGDGALDVAITQPVASSSCGSLPSLAIFVGPTLSHVLPCLPAGSDPSAVQTGDFDADGQADLAVVSGSASGLRIFKGAGDATFAQVITGETNGAVPGSFINATRMAPPVDLNGDGVLDLVVGHSAGVSTFLGDRKSVV